MFGYTHLIGFFFISYVWMWISTKTYALFNQIQVHISRTEAMPDSFQSTATVDSGWLKIGSQSCQLLLFQCNYYCYFWRCWQPFGVLFFLLDSPFRIRFSIFTQSIQAAKQLYSTWTCAWYSMKKNDTTNEPRYQLCWEIRMMLTQSIRFGPLAAGLSMYFYIQCCYCCRYLFAPC